MAQRALQAMEDEGEQPSPDCYGLVVHALARDYDMTSAFALLRRMHEAGVQCPEHHAKLMRARCKELGVWSPLVPAHPHAWQFSPAVMRKRKARGKRVNVVAKHYLKS